MTASGAPAERWSQQTANDWYADQPWLVGCNFIPSTAVNQLEMWQADTFDDATIDRELGWASALGFNTMRVFLHDLLWEADPTGFSERIDRYLTIAVRHGIRTMCVLFDDCWHGGAKLGPQPAPVPGRHNSRWLQSPGHSVIAAGDAKPRLEAYVRGVIDMFRADERVLAWDLYNEITNGFLPAQALPAAERQAASAQALARRSKRKPAHLALLDDSFRWARAAAPTQPLTAGLWMGDGDLNARLIDLSDVLTFHSYDHAERLMTLIERLRRHGRPLICTEYMARTRGSDFASTLPVFKAERVGCYNWGLVNGKTQTHIAWTGESDRWFHDILRPDGAPYDPAEAAFIKGMTGA
jgi:hypothetical protein